MTAAEHRILVVDDEKSITDLVTMALHLHGADVEVAHTGNEALRAVEAFRPHLVVLDVMLPDLDGFTVLERMGRERRSADIPVLFLTARGDLDDRLRGLELGGDDYMTKPFSVEEMLLRITAILRRSEGYDDVGPRLAVADVELDEESHEVRRGGARVELTPTEFRLLHYLMMNAGQVVSKAQIRDRVWDYSFDGKVNMVEVYVSYLRKKLDAHGPPLIRTVRGLGYSMRTCARPRCPRCPATPVTHAAHPRVPIQAPEGLVTLRLRLLLLLVGIVAAGLVISDVVTYNALRSFLTTRVDQQLEVAAFPVGRALLSSSGLGPRVQDAPPALTPGGSRPFTPPGSFRNGGGLLAPGRGSDRGVLVPPGTYGQLRNTKGATEAHLFFDYGGRAPTAPVLPARLPGSGLPSGADLYFTASGTGPGAVTYRALAKPLADRSGVIVVAVPLSDLDSTLRRLLWIELIVSALVLVGLGVLSWVMVRRDLRPLEAMTKTAGAIAHGDLSRRVSPAAGGTEVGQLGKAFNTMINEIEVAFAERAASEERLRRFLADASHELRTPLTSILGYSELFGLGVRDRPADLSRLPAPHPGRGHEDGHAGRRPVPAGPVGPRASAAVRAGGPGRSGQAGRRCPLRLGPRSPRQRGGRAGRSWSRGIPTGSAR